MALSGGERRRCEIARSLAAEPSIMLLDEPFAGIDPISIADIRELVKDLKERDIGVLITDHNVRETLDIVDRACIIYDGQVLFEGTPQALVADENVRRLYLGEELRPLERTPVAMGLGPRIDLRVSQQLVMTQQLQQAIKLLALSNLEIEAVIAEELAKNPCSRRGPAREPGEGVIVREDREFGDEGRRSHRVDELIGSELGTERSAGRHGLARRRRWKPTASPTSAAVGATKMRSISIGWKAARIRPCRASAGAAARRRRRPSAGWPRRSSMSWRKPAISKRRCG